MTTPLKIQGGRIKQFISGDALVSGVIGDTQITTEKIVGNAITGSKIEDKFFAYGQIYGTVSQGAFSANVWNTLAFTSGINLNNTTTDLSSITVTYAGIYKITYAVTTVDPSNASVHKARLTKNVGAIEIEGSCDMGTPPAGAYIQLGKAVISSLNAEDYIQVQVGNNYGNFYVNCPAESPVPTYPIRVIITIEKLDD